jgi:hypothetical protein
VLLVGRFSQSDGVGASLWGDPMAVNKVCKVGDHKGRPYSRQRVVYPALRMAALVRHHHRRVVVDTAVKVGDVFVVHADAAIGHKAADRFRPVGAVDSVFAAR